MKVAILGAGSLGSVFGGALARAGEDVLLVTRDRAHVEAIRRDGLILIEDGREHPIAVAATTTAVGHAPVDLLIVLVKSFDTGPAMRSALDLVGPRTVVLSLQNGLGHEDVLAAIVGRDKVMAGKTWVGGLRAGPGRVVAGSRGKETIIGELDGVLTPRLTRIVESFRHAGIDTVATRTIRATIWDKLFVNVATGALAAITRLPYGELYAVPEIEAVAVAAVAEAMAVARAEGAEPMTKTPSDAWMKAAEGLPAEFKTSMLQSLEKGSRTEIDFVNGAVVRHGRALGVPTPVNETLVAVLKGVEHALFGPPQPIATVE